MTARARTKLTARPPDPLVRPFLDVIAAAAKRLQLEKQARRKRIRIVK